MVRKPQREVELRYLEALSESYPNPVSHTDLAYSVGVSKAAVTGVKGRLRNFCDLNELVDRKFLLKDDARTGGNLLQKFLLKGKIKFLSSRYGRWLLKGTHDQIVKSWPGFGDVFEKDDTNFLMDTILTNLAVAKDTEKLLTYFQSVSQSPNPSLDLILDKIVVDFKDEKRLLRFFEIRDKAFYLIGTELARLLGEFEVIKQLDDIEKKMFMDVYSKTAEFYLRKYFGELTAQIALRAKEEGIEFKTEYYEIGRFYQPVRVPIKLKVSTKSIKRRV